MSEYEVTVNLPNRPKGVRVDIPPYGSFTNGETFSLDMLPADAIIFNKLNRFMEARQKSRYTPNKGVSRSGTSRSRRGKHSRSSL